MALTYVRLIWRVLDVIGDTSDPDHLPDDSPLPDKTSLTLTMAAATIIDLSERPAITHYPQPIPCTVDSQGNMLDPQGNIGVYIIDPTNQTLQPHDWTISLRLEVPGRPTKTWSVKLTIHLLPVTSLSAPARSRVHSAPSGRSGFSTNSPAAKLTRPTWS